MPLLTLHLLRLKTSCSAKDFLGQLQTAASNIEIVVAAEPRFLVVRPTKQDVSLLQDVEYNLMLLLRGQDGSEATRLMAKLSSSIEKEYKMFVGIPTKITSTYKDRNQTLLDEAARAPLTGSLDNPKIPDSSQNLELSPDLLRFMEENRSAGPMTMLNLLNFHKDGKPSYYQYGQVGSPCTLLLYQCSLSSLQGFKEVAGKRGGDAKIVGNVVAAPEAAATSQDHETVVAGADKWQEVAIVHYASIVHFCDMLAGEDYQAINAKWRLPVRRTRYCSNRSADFVTGFGGHPVVVYQRDRREWLLAEGQALACRFFRQIQFLSILLGRILLRT